ncbi:MAG: GAF domain-containing protein [Anaerolineales bacterium]|nr:GAF domain-containing protein [Anaerolineales bacterium]
MNNPVPQLIQQEERRRRNALAISLVTGILFTIVVAIVGPVAYNENGVSGLWGIAITALVAIAAFIGSFIIHRGNVTLGIGILIGTILVLSFALPIVARGQGLALGIMILVTVAGISSATLTSTWAIRAIVSAFVIAVFITLTDLYLPNFGLSTNPAYSNIIAIITSLIYAFFLLRNFNLYTLQTKIVIAFILVTIIPLVVLGFFNSQLSARALQAQSKTQLTTLANVVADTVDDFIAVQLDSIRTDAKQLSLIEYIQSPASDEKETNARLVLLSLTRKDPVFIHSIAILNIEGENILDTFDEHQGQNEGNFAYFTRPIQTGLPYASNVIFNDSEESIYFSSPVKTQNGETIGLLRVEYRATVIQSIIRPIIPDDTGTLISLVDANTYVRVGYTGNDRDELFKSYKNFADLEVAALQAENRLPPGPKENAIDEPDDETVAGLDNLQQQPFFNSNSDSLNSESINTGVFLKTQPWVALIRQSTAVYLEPVRDQNRVTILVSLGLIILSVAGGLFASQILTLPLITLAKVAEKIAAGDFNARAQATTEDEIGALSSSFNRMTDELNQTFNNLEIRVAERTTDLEMARQQSEKRANELQSIGEIAKVITGEQKLENLLPLISRLVSERFGFYHTGIFLIDETNQFAVLQAANSEGGKNMLERGHKLQVGGSGIVGHVAKFGSSRIALDVGLDAVYFDNPDLPNTRSEMALPLMVRDRIVGVLDVQSERPGAFTDDDAKTLNILADQVAIALENARLFTQTQQALNEAQALYRQNLQEGWLSFSREEASIGYQQSLRGGKKLTTPIETDEIRQAMNRGDVLVFNANETTRDASIVVPIKLRGQIIGALNIKAPTQGRRWTNDEVNLAEVISERLSLALENARLIQESQRQVIKEQTISEVTGKIGASINLKNVLQTAVEELGRAMPGSEVLIKFQNEDSNGNGK